MALVFNAAVLSRQADIPAQFVWPSEEAPAVGSGVEEIAIPVVDLAAFLAAGGYGGGLGELAAACERHGFFQVVNHGVDPALLAEAYRCCDAFYARPLAEKLRAQRRPGGNHGYAGSFTGRFHSRLPWKETLSFNCSAAPENARMVVDYYFVAVLDEEYRRMGYVMLTPPRTSSKTHAYACRNYVSGITKPVADLKSIYSNFLQFHDAL